VLPLDGSSFPVSFREEVNDSTGNRSDRCFRSATDGAPRRRAGGGSGTTYREAEGGRRRSGKDHFLATMSHDCADNDVDLGWGNSSA